MCLELYFVHIVSLNPQQPWEISGVIFNFTDEESESQRDEVLIPCPRSHG